MLGSHDFATQATFDTCPAVHKRRQLLGLHSYPGEQEAVQNVLCASTLEQSPFAPLVGGVEASHAFGVQEAAVKVPPWQLVFPFTV